MVSDTQFWDDAAEKYSRKPVANVDAYQRKLAITKERLTPTDVILDIGCGTGSLALELAPHVAEVHSLDISAEMLRIAKRKAFDAGVSNITFHQGTLETTAAFRAEQFDGVCAYNIVHLVRDRVATLHRIYELLKPGGWFIQSTAVLADSWVPFSAVLTVMQWLGKAPTVHIFGKDVLLGEIRDAGFVSVASRDVGAKKETAFVVAAKP